MKILSCYYEDAKILGYNWNDLLKKETRREVMNEVEKYRLNKSRHVMILHPQN